MGNARGGVLGDTLANVLKRDGCDTWKEFYVNDAGNQIHKFAVSIDARYHPELRRQFMPKRFWKNLTELQESPAALRTALR